MVVRNHPIRIHTRSALGLRITRKTSYAKILSHEGFVKAAGTRIEAAVKEVLEEAADQAKLSQRVEESTLAPATPKPIQGLGEPPRPSAPALSKEDTKEAAIEILNAMSNAIDSAEKELSLIERDPKRLKEFPDLFRQLRTTLEAHAVSIKAGDPEAARRVVEVAQGSQPMGSVLSAPWFIILQGKLGEWQSTLQLCVVGKADQKIERRENSIVETQANEAIDRKWAEDLIEDTILAGAVRKYQKEEAAREGAEEMAEDLLEASMRSTAPKPKGTPE